MALIKHSSAKTLARDAIVLDLGDLRRQGEQLVESARQKAAAIIADATAQRDRLINGAAERGYQDGLTRGLAEGTAKGEAAGRAAALEQAGPQLTALQSAWTTALQQFAADRDRILHEAELDVLRLAVAMGEKVTKRAVELDGRIVAAQLAAVLALVVRPTAVVIAINPEDRATAERALPNLIQSLPAIRHAELIDDPTLRRGSCIVRTRGAGADQPTDGPAAAGHIDASIDTQLARIAEALLPGQKEPDGGDQPAPAAP